MHSNRKPIGLVLIVVLAMLGIAALPSSASASDKDCADFATQRAAQIFFLKHGGPTRDPHRLDGDDDGVACEDNPCPCYFKKHLPRSSLWQREFVFSSGYAELKRRTQPGRRSGGGVPTASPPA